MQIIKDIAELTPTAQEACKLFLYECEQQGLKVKITETYRSQERQNELYAQGRTKAGQIVTWTKKSRHTSRRAWDICQDIKGQEYSDNSFFKNCGIIAKGLDITWGGTWKTPDKPHFEISEDWECKKMTDTERKQFNLLVGQVATLTERLAEATDKLAEVSMVYNYFDKNFPSWAEDEIKEATELGIVKGTENGLGLTMGDIKSACYILRAFKKVGLIK